MLVVAGVRHQTVVPLSSVSSTERATSLATSDNRQYI